MQVHYDRDADLSRLRPHKIAILGFGSQGHAHALNLRDSGMDVCVGLRKDSPSWEKAGQAGPAGFRNRRGRAPRRHRDDAGAGRDGRRNLRGRNRARSLRRASTWPSATASTSISSSSSPPPDVNVFMIAPKGPGHLVRSEYVKGRGVPCLLAVEQDPSGDTKQVGLAYGSAIGGGRAAIIETSFREETETDLFGEQSVLCGGLTELIRAGFETLVEAGYAPEMAYFECVHEVKLIVDLIYEGGIANMRYSISNTAEYGDMTRGKRVVGPRLAPGDEGIARRYPVGQVRQRMDRRVPRRTAAFPRAAQGSGESSARRSRAQAALLHAVAGERSPGRQSQELNAAGGLTDSDGITGR